ncbi:hypothetical protein JW905_12265 [bacterium]|nr:hypothetical protein [candidate division CSSED10-310 bacterium]
MRRLQQTGKVLAALNKALEQPVDEAFELAAQVAILDDLVAAAGGESGRQVAAALHERLPEWKRERTMRFARALVDAFHAAGREVTVRGAEYLVAGMVLRVDLGANRAVLEYARETVRDKIPLRPAAIVKAVESAHRELTGKSMDAGAFIKLLFEAYRRVLKFANDAPGERANVIDVLAELAFVLQRDTFRRDPRRELFQSYSRARFSHDLNRLRVEGVLEHASYRLNIGTATIDFAEDRRRALYLTDGRGGGNYIMYLSFKPSSL